MARGRMLSKSLSTSAKIATLYKVCPKLAEFCRALFPLLIAHADDHGRLPGDDFTVKVQIDPISPRKPADFVAALHILHEVDLIVWYQVGDRKVIEIVKFSEHQDLKGHENRPWKLPPCTSPEEWIGRKRGTLGESGDSTKEKRREVNLREVNLTEAGVDRFSVFWAAYPKKVGKDAARVAFTKRAVRDDLLHRMLEALRLQKQSRDWTKDGGQYIPHPATWLNAARWEDEPTLAPLVSDRTQQLMQSDADFDRLVKK